MHKSKTVEEITSLLAKDKELREKVKLNIELVSLFETLPKEKQGAVIENIKDKYPAVAQALSEIQGGNHLWQR